MELRAHVESLAKEQGGFLTWADLRAHVSPRRISGAVRNGVLLHRGHGVYALPEAPLDPDIRGTALSLKGVVSHDTAAMWWGIELAHTPGTQHLTVPRNRGRRRDEKTGWQLHRCDLGPTDKVLQEGIQVTSPLRTVIDCARLLPLPAAVAICDSALRKRLITRQELEEALASLRPGPGRRSVERVVGLADSKAGSVLESLLRILLWQYGLLPPATQMPIRIAGVLGYFDFAWPALRLVVEADGFAFHSKREDLRRDCLRHNGLTVEGWWLLRFTWQDVVFFPGDVIAVVQQAMARLGAG
jgi:very-short-patch-repair endonuclease